MLQFKKIDDVLRIFKERREGEHPDVKVGVNVTAAVSQALYYAFAKATAAQTPFLSMFKTNLLREFRPETDKVPKLMFTVLNGGKEHGSKVKFSKFFLIFDVKP